jgi:hypothetical protein
VGWTPFPRLRRYKAAVASGVKATMKRIVTMFLVVLSCNSYGWECDESNSSYDFNEHWNNAKLVFVGRIINGIYNRDGGYDNQYSYTVGIDAPLKGNESGVVKLTGDETAPRLAIGANYVFFLQNDSKVNLCTVVLPFEFHWEERVDIEEAEYVRKIIALSKQKP